MRFLFRAIPQTLSHLALFAVMLVAFAPQTASFWTCDGLPCGTTPWTCCCSDPDDAQGGICVKSPEHLQSGIHAQEMGVCPADCHCTKVMQEGTPHLTSAPFAFVAPPVFVVPVSFAALIEAPVRVTPTFPQLSRGPPPGALYLASHYLRGPPVA